MFQPGRWQYDDAEAHLLQEGGIAWSSTHSGCPTRTTWGFPASAKGILDTAIKAEELGFDAVFVNDHVIVDDGARSEPWRQVYDPLMSLAYVASRTSKIGLGTSVLIMPYRNPVVTAKMVATLDQMSDGRAIVGVGSGWNETEYAALDVPHRERGARTNEYLRLWKACWSRTRCRSTGGSSPLTGCTPAPSRCSSRTRPSGSAGPATCPCRRAARFAQVWQPTPTPLPTLVSNWQYLNDVSAEIGREEPPRVRMSFRVNISSISGHSVSDSDRPTGYGSTEQIVSDINRYRQESGLDEFQINCHDCGDLQQLLDTMDALVQDVFPKVDA